MSTWLGATFGVFLLAVVLLMLWFMCSEATWRESTSTFVFGLVLLFVGLALGLWLVWPIVLGIGDILHGTQDAAKYVASREGANATDRAVQASGFASLVSAIAVACAVVAPVLSYSMLREGTAAGWGRLILLASPIGCLVAAARWGSLVGLNFHQTQFGTWIVTSTHEATSPLTVFLYAEMIWFGLVATRHISSLAMGPISIFLAPFAILPWLIGFYLQAHWIVQALLLVVSGLIGAVLNMVRTLEIESEQRRRNVRANRIVERSTDTEPQQFWLYLRSFGTTARVDSQWHLSEESERLDIETVLEKAIGPHAELIALGARTEPEVLGAGRLYVPDAKWFERFRKLAVQATRIVILPSSHGSALDEIRWLKQGGHLARCLFLMPETASGRWGFDFSFPTTVRVATHVAAIDHERDWESAVRAVKDTAGIQLPPYENSGAIFSLNTDGTVRNYKRLNLSRGVFRVLKVRRVLQAVSPSDLGLLAPDRAALG
jgi:hypothetical protein